MCHEMPGFGIGTQTECPARQLLIGSRPLLADHQSGFYTDCWINRTSRLERRVAKRRTRAWRPASSGHLIRPDATTAGIGIGITRGCAPAFCSRPAALRTGFSSGFCRSGLRGFCRSSLRGFRRSSLRGFRSSCLGLTNRSDEFAAGLFSFAHQTITS